MIKDHGKAVVDMEQMLIRCIDIVLFIHQSFSPLLSPGQHSCPIPVLLRPQLVGSALSYCSASNLAASSERMAVPTPLLVKISSRRQWAWRPSRICTRLTPLSMASIQFSIL